MKYKSHKNHWTTMKYYTSLLHTKQAMDTKPHYYLGAKIKTIFNQHAKGLNFHFFSFSQLLFLPQSNAVGSF